MIVGNQGWFKLYGALKSIDGRYRPLLVKEFKLNYVTYYIKNDPSKIIIAQGRHLPIIDEGDFVQVQQKLAEKKKTWRPSAL